MMKKNYIFVLTFLCLLCGQMGYGQDVYKNENNDTGDVCDKDSKAYDFCKCYPNAVTCDTINLPEIIIDKCDPDYVNYDFCKCKPEICKDCTNPLNPAYPCEYEDTGDCTDERSTAFPCYDPCDSGSDDFDICLCDPASCEEEPSTEPQDPPLESENITNEVADPCIKGVVDKVINGLSTNPFTKILKGDFYKQDNQSLKFTQYYNNSVDGIKVDGRLASGNMYQQNIELNMAALENASQEFISATIYHEIIHAYMRSTNIASSEHHELLATEEWRDKISNQLQIDYPNLSKEDAEGLAWGGLGSTSKWKTMNDNDINNNTSITGDIEAVNDNHKNLNNSTNGQYGTKCTN